MKIKLGYLIIFGGIVLLALGISGIFGWETNIGLDLLGVGLAFLGLILLLGSGASGSYAGMGVKLGSA